MHHEASGKPRFLLGLFFGPEEMELTCFYETSVDFQQTT
jgi:hypothetical protein